jgi:hypothetical protein
LPKQLSEDLKAIMEDVTLTPEEREQRKKETLDYYFEYS